VYVAIAAITALHYSTGTHAHQLHDIYRRLYYLPIILAAFIHGFRGGLIAAAVVCVAYFPHAFGHITMDPASNTEKVLEMVLYLAVGLTTGALVSRLKGTQHELRGSIEQLRSTEEQLIRTAKLAAVGRLSAGLAHEIRNPLGSIKGSAEMLADDFPAEHPKRRLLLVLVEEAERLNQVLTRFLAFARPRPLERQEVEIAAEIEGVVTFLKAQRGNRNVQIQIDPYPAGPSIVRGDREQLRQVLLNILLNACQGAGEGGTVRIWCNLSHGMFRVCVHDSGYGFTEEALENAFTPFFTTKDQGTGLGLAISHRIIDSHGGRLLVSNAENGGGLVEVEIPLQITDG
jgi:signal transduction histidine kinase